MLFGLFAGIAGALAFSTAKAADWLITPRVGLSETYTDNVTEAASNKESDFITEISPGVNIQGIGSRLKLSFDYRLQSLFFADDSDRNDIHHGLNAVGAAELLPDLFYVDTRASVTQQIVSAQQRVSLDNFTASDNRTDVRTFTISPYLRNDFGGYADGLLRYTHDIVDYGDDGDASDSHANSVGASLRSGRHWGRMSWGLGFNDQDIQRANDDDAKFQSLTADAAYRVSETVSVVAQGGREDNDFTSSEAIVNGSYSAFGLAWTPSRYIAMRALTGSRYKTAGVTLTPSKRTQLAVSYRDRDVGLNPGKVWTGNLLHTTRHTLWEASYLEDTVTQQQLALFQTALPYIDPDTGQPALDPSTGLPLYLNENFDPVPMNPNNPFIHTLGSLFDEVIERERASIAVGYHRRKTMLRLSSYREDRRYLTSGATEDARGIEASWGWRFGARTRSLLQIGKHRNELTTGVGQEDVLFIQAGITRELSPTMTGTVQLRHFDQDSDSVANEYTENRITAGVNIRF